MANARLDSLPAWAKELSEKYYSRTITMFVLHGNALVTLKRWAQHPAFLSADLTICLIAENLSELNQGLIQNPGVAAISVPLPSEAERLEFIRAFGAVPMEAGLTAETLATLTAG